MRRCRGHISEECQPGYMLGIPHERDFFYPHCNNPGCRPDNQEGAAYAGEGRISQVVRHIDMSTILFFLGILLSVGALQQAGILNGVAHWLNDTPGCRPDNQEGAAYAGTECEQVPEQSVLDEKCRIGRIGRGCNHRIGWHSSDMWPESALYG